MIKCSECGYENMDGLDYCDGCGAKLEATVPSAGSGAALPPGASSNPTEAPQPRPDQEIAPGATASTAADSSAAETGESTNTAASAGAASHSNATGSEAAAAKAPTGEMNAAAASPASEVTAETAPFKAKLAIIRGGRRGQEFELESGNNLVGRWDPDTGAFPEVDLDADDPEAKVSRKHALIRLDGGKITIEDIGSLNGTYVNRQPRLQPGSPLNLKDGDEIIIGKTFLKLSINPIS